MGKQSARMYYNESDHKEIYFNGNYHDAMYLTDADANAELIWQKLQNDDYFSVRVIDYMVDYTTGEMPSGGVGGYVKLNISQNTASYDYIVDWGDGTVEKNVNSHRYATSDGTEYIVKIRGKTFLFQSMVVYKNAICSCITKILTPITKGMSVSYFDIESGVPSYASMFGYCSKLKDIPSDLFSKVTDYKNVTCNGMFQYCGLLSVPTGLFAGTNKWTINAFYTYNNNLTSIQFGAFYGVDFDSYAADGVIANCASLRFVYDYPANVGVNLLGTSVEVFDCYLYNLTSMKNAFNGITTLTTISDKLFRNCPDIESFDGCFRGCTALEEIPVGLFDGLEKVTDYDYCFYGCASIKEIPSDLFEDSYSANTFTQTFLRCYGLTSIPQNLFVNCAEGSNFSGTFMGCENITSRVPELWNYTDNGYRCYNGCVNASNYDDIPEDWK